MAERPKDPKDFAHSQDSLDLPSQLSLPSLEATPAERQLYGLADTMQLRELLNARNELSRIINRKYKRNLALCFCDIVGSTQYMARFGDEAGQAIMQRLMVLVAKALPVAHGTLVETTGDGVFLTWTSVDNAVASLLALRKAIDQDNFDIPGEQRLAVRIGVHWGSALADGDLVTGENVNLTARVTALADDGQIVMTRAAFSELSPHARPPGRAMPPQVLKGIPVPIETLVLDWRDPHLFPRRMRVLETGDEYELPDRDNLSFGRTAASETEKENDVVLTHPDATVRQKVSRRQFSLHRHPDGWRLRLLSERPVEVDGVAIQRGMEAQVKSGSVVRLAGVLSLMFLSLTTSEKMNDPNKTVM